MFCGFSSYMHEQQGQYEMSSRDDGSPVRIVVAGIGGRGHWAAGKFKADEQFELAAICEKDERLLAYLQEAEGFGDVPGYTSFDECLAKEDCEAVAVTASDCHHAELALPALEAGKFVYVDKPLETTEEKCRAIIKADEKAGYKTFVGFNLRFAPVYVKLKELLDQGVTGDILTIQADELYNGGRTYFRRWNRLRDHSGGLWITKASHDFDIMYWLSGNRKPLSVQAFAELSHYTKRDDVPLYCGECRLRDTCDDSYYRWERTDREGKPKKKPIKEILAERGGQRPDLCLWNSDKDTFDHGVAAVEFEGGVFATYTCNVVSAFSNRTIRIIGSKGTIEADLEANKVYLSRREGTNSPAPEDAREEIPVPTAEGGHGGSDVVIFNSLYEFVKGIREPKVRPAEAMIAVLMGLAATRSGDEGRLVQMSEFGL